MSKSLPFKFPTSLSASFLMIFNFSWRISAFRFPADARAFVRWLGAVEVTEVDRGLGGQGSELRVQRKAGASARPAACATRATTASARGSGSRLRRATQRDERCGHEQPASLHRHSFPREGVGGEAKAGARRAGCSCT